MSLQTLAQNAMLRAQLALEAAAMNVYHAHSRIITRKQLINAYKSHAIRINLSN